VVDPDSAADIRRLRVFKWKQREGAKAAVLDIGAAIRASDLVLPEGVKVHSHHAGSIVASIGTSSAMGAAAAADAEA
jgi:hypothetical protein